ncbi:MAG: energy transducer TonB [Syntrophales bacterium]|jgi:TonB family protein|nr:energy transducer TonB [Syntrophales bacterium]
MTDPIDTITLDPGLVESIDHLRARSYEKPALGSVLVSSIMIHALFLSLVLFRPMTTAMKLTLGPYYTVDLVRDVEVSGRRLNQSTFSRDMKELLGDQSGTVLKKKADTLELPPISRLDSGKKPSQDVAEAIEELRRKMAGDSPPKRPPAVTDAPASTASSAALDEMNAYYGAVWSRIRTKWAFPGGILPGNDLVAVVHVRIMKNGAIEGVALEKRSANAFFNESAVKAVKKAAPFPPFPVWMRDSSIEVGIRFHSSQLNMR